MENTEYIGFISVPANKEEKARRELETNELMAEQAKRENAELQKELEELNKRRYRITERLARNGREIVSYGQRTAKLTQFLALAEEI